MRGMAVPTTDVFSAISMNARQMPSMAASEARKLRADCVMPVVQGKDDTYGATEITEQYALSQSVHCLFVAGTHELALSPQQWDSLTQTIIDFCDAAVLRRPFSTSRFDEDFYLRSHPDVATALAAGPLTSAEQHYRIWGHKEGRSFRLLPSD